MMINRFSISLALLLMCFLVIHQVNQSRNQLAAKLLAMRFCDPQATTQQAEHALQVDARLNAARQSSEAGLIMNPDREFQSWRKQFPKGDEECQQRLALQSRSEASMKSDILKAQLDQAYAEKEIPTVSESAVRAWYDRHGEEMRLPAAHHVQHLFLSRHDPSKSDRQAAIDSLHQRLIQGESWADLTAQSSEDERSKFVAGDLGWVTKNRMPADFMTAVEAAPLGQISQPIESKLGWHILRVLERRESRLPTFDEARAEIHALLDQRQREQAFRAAFAH